MACTKLKFAQLDAQIQQQKKQPSALLSKLALALARRHESKYWRKLDAQIQQQKNHHDLSDITIIDTTVKPKKSRYSRN